MQSCQVIKKQAYQSHRQTHFQRKELSLQSHSEKKALAVALAVAPKGAITITKNLRVCRGLSSPRQPSWTTFPDMVWSPEGLASRPSPAFLASFGWVVGVGHELLGQLGGF